MSTAQIWNNIVAYSLQIGLLVGLGSLVPVVLRLRAPCKTTLLASAGCGMSGAAAGATLAAGSDQCLRCKHVAGSWPAHHWPLHRDPRRRGSRRRLSLDSLYTAIVLCLLVTGVIIRIVWLAIGLARLAGYRRRGHELASDPVFRIATAISARWLVSDEIASPVTFGWRDPVVLLPARFPLLKAELREAILCHELIHVERRDWMFTLAEEMVRAMLWFHPAIWWLLGEIQLSREQTVDEAVIEITHARSNT